MEWIKYNEFVPIMAGFYLTYHELFGLINKTEFNGKDQWDSPFGTPSHWMKLPEPPKGNEDANSA